MTKDNCPICTNLSRTKSWVTCPKCKFACCRSCTKKYLLSAPDINPKCMSCKYSWDFEFVSDNTDYEFHDITYRERRCKVIMERERSLLPATQPYVVTEKKITSLQDEYDRLLAKSKRIAQKLAEVNRDKKLIRDQLNAAKRGTILDKAVEPVANNKFNGNCPQPDCKGFLGSNYVCGLCEKKACKKCRQVKHKGTECDPNTIETVKTLAMDTKRCPNCGIPIYKISGCDQMFCTKCHTAFDWKTGKIETGRVHNPHYYEFVRRTGGDIREPGDVRCGGVVPVHTLRNALADAGIDRKMNDNISNAHRATAHNRDIAMRRYLTNEVSENTHRDLRIKYLCGDIDEKRWFSLLKKREKEREKKRAISMILTMYIDTIEEIFNNMCIVKTKDEINKCVVQLTDLKVYSNEYLTKLAKRFKSQIPVISEDWAWRLESRK